MEETIVQQLAVAGFAFLFGIFMGTVYDAITILRCTVCLSSGLPEKQNRLFDREWPLIGRVVRQTRRGKLEYFWLFWSDLLFWTLLTLGSILFLFFFYDGRFRWFFAGSGLIGFVLYRLSVSRFVQLLFRYLLFFFKLFLRYLLHFVKIPFIMIAVEVSKGAKALWQILRRLGFAVARVLWLRHLTDQTEKHLPALLEDIR